MRDAVSTIFKPYRVCCLEAGLAEDLDILIESRVQRLAAMGETADDFVSVMSKGASLDMASEFAVGWVRSMFFGAIAAVLDKFPELTSFSSDPAKKGAVAGAYSQIADYGGVKLISPVLDNTLWLDRGEGSIESEAMKKALERLDPTTLRRAVEVAMHAQWFSARNVFKVLIAPPLAPEASAIFLSAMSSAGSAFAGAFMRLSDHRRQRDTHRVGAAVMLAREDWEKVYQDLKHYHPVTGPIVGVGKRLSRVPSEVFTRTHLCDAAMSLFSSDSMATGAALVGGFAGNDAAVSAVSAAVKSNASLSPFTRVFLQQLTNAASMAPVYSLWSVLGVFGDPKWVKPVATAALNGIGSSIKSAFAKVSAAVERVPPQRPAWAGVAHGSSAQWLVTPAGPFEAPEVVPSLPPLKRVSTFATSLHDFTLDPLA